MYTVAESAGAVVMFRIVKRTMTTQPVSVLFSTSPGTATGNRSFPEMSWRGNFYVFGWCGTPYYQFALCVL